MSDKPATVIVSDLHVGGGAADLGDDHVYDTQQFVRLTKELLAEKNGADGKTELIINGDFLEFAQVLPEVYKLGSADYWCSESESLQKLDAILSGHSEIFESLAEFQGYGNVVTLAAGNHDVDLYWPRVQQRIQEKAGPIQFELGNNDYSRYDGKLRIGHGHMDDPANLFKYWNDPLLKMDSGEVRLEMCPGTLLMVKFVNWLENKYKFADNVMPVTALGRILWKESKLGLLSVAWTLTKFAGRHPQTSMSAKQEPPEIGETIRQHFGLNQEFQTKITQMYNEVYGLNFSPEKVLDAIKPDEDLANFLSSLIGKYPPDIWGPVFDNVKSPKTASIINAGNVNEKIALREAAKKMFTNGAKIVVFGHTHQPDEYHNGDNAYFNPGSWTRYLDIEKLENLKLEDLQNEEDFPYQLNYIRVEDVGKDRLVAEKRCFEKQDGKKFKVE